MDSPKTLLLRDFVSSIHVDNDVHVGIKEMCTAGLRRALYIVAMSFSAKAGARTFNQK
jgi:hypothetical protein